MIAVSSLFLSDLISYSLATELACIKFNRACLLRAGVDRFVSSGEFDARGLGWSPFSVLHGRWKWSRAGESGLH